MRYCSHCGALVAQRVPAGDTLPRFVCAACQSVHYTNPKVVVGCIPQWQGQILLCRRAIEPRRGLWTLPAGFLEDHETTTEGAVRETLEESGAKVEVAELYALFNLPHVNQVYVMFRADLRERTFSPGAESLEVGLYDEQDIPWQQLAFPVIEQTLKLYYQDRTRGRFGTYTGDIIRLPGEPKSYEVRFLKRSGDAR